MPKKNKPLRIAIYLIILFVMTCMGVGAGMAYHALAKTTYESRAVFRIDVRKIPQPFENLDFSRTTEARHDRLMTQPNIIQTCLLKNRLTNLRTFESTAEDDIVPMVQDNFVVTQDPTEPTLYTAVLRCSRPDDAQTLLNNLIHAYCTDLEAQEEQVVHAHENQLKNLLAKAQSELESAKKAGKPNGPSFDKLAERQADLKQQAVKLEVVRNGNRGSLITTTQTLQNATYGDVVWPILPVILLIGAASGFGFGLLLMLLWFFLDSLS